ncbi:ABC transporter permease [Streptomyces sp. NPDC060194]|uniref:ABC transporter permease n=1 Tax=Streptomyces sp. NPDC060194 TaxID=3347069 RepID=UPI00364DB033
MFRTALRNVLAHKARLLMTVLAVMLGVAFVSGTLVFTDTLGTAYKNQSAKSYDDVAVAVEYDGDGKGLSQAEVDALGRLDGVREASGQVGGFAAVADRDGKMIGEGWSNAGRNASPTGDEEFTAGRAPAKDDQVALDRGTAQEGGFRTGDRVRVAGNGPAKEYTLSGVFTTDDGAVSAGGSLSLFSTAEAQRLFGEPGHYDAVTIGAEPGTSDTALLTEVRKALPEDATASTGAELAAQQAKDIEAGFSTMKQGLLAFAGIALFVGVFLIYNTFAMLVAQRTKELALLRAVGATRRQVTRSVLSEALVVGAVASAVGFAAGVGLAAALRPAMASFGMQVPDGPLVIGWVTVAAALAVGVVITMVSAWLPARRAARIPPVAAMGSVHATATVRSLVVRNTIGAVITLGGGALIAAGASKGSDTGRLMIAGGAFLALVGVIVLIPLLSRPTVALVRPLLVRVFGVSGNLAARNAVRNPRRTGATAAALAIGLTLVTGITTLGVTLGQAIDRMTTDNIRADYMVTMANGMPLNASAVDALAKSPAVTAYSPQQAGDVELDGGRHAVSGVHGADLGKVLNLEVGSGSASSLAKGQALVAEETAKGNGWRTGDTLPVEYPDGTKGRITVGGTYEGNEFLSPVLLDTATLNRHLDGEAYVPEVYVTTDGGPSAKNEQALVDALGENPAVTVLDKQDIRDMFGGAVNTMLNLMYGLLGMALLIAVLGVVNTLAMSVFERQQEIGMLRAIGLDRGRVKRMVRVEAVVIALFGAVLGVTLGAFLAWAIGETVAGSVPGYTLVIPWERIGVFLALAAAVGVLASLWPARSAARLNMLTAIKTE